LKKQQNSSSLGNIVQESSGILTERIDHNIDSTNIERTKESS